MGALVQNRRKYISCSQDGKRRLIMRTTITVEAGGMFFKEPCIIISMYVISENQNIVMWIDFCCNSRGCELLRHAPIWGTKLGSVEHWCLAKGLPQWSVHWSTASL